MEKLSDPPRCPKAPEVADPEVHTPVMPAPRGAGIRCSASTGSGNLRAPDSRRVCRSRQAKSVRNVPNQHRGRPVALESHLPSNFLAGNLTKTVPATPGSRYIHAKHGPADSKWRMAVNGG